VNDTGVKRSAPLELARLDGTVSGLLHREPGFTDFELRRAALASTCGARLLLKYQNPGEYLRPGERVNWDAVQQSSRADK